MLRLRGDSIYRGRRERISIISMMRCSAVTETSVEPGQVEQEPAGLSSTSSMVLPPDCGKAWLYTARVDCATARCALRQAQKVPSQKA